MDGQTPRRIRRVIQCSQATMTAELNQIRQRFVTFGFD
jgi:hypothetical protein